MKETFKAGDKVYYPERSNLIYELSQTDDTLFPVKIDIGTDYFIFTENGLCLSQSYTPSIFLATDENRRKLTELYGVEFKCPISLVGEIVQAMLNDGWKSVPCYVSDSSEFPTSYDFLAYIKKVTVDGGFIKADGTKWKYATPFDPRTGKTIIDYVDGQIVME